METFGKKLTVYMIDGTDSGPRTIEIGNWSGKAVHAPKSRLISLMDRPEFDKPGVYILKSDPQESFYNERIYIGEAENIKKRLKQHLGNSEKEFNEVIFFISKDELLTKSHIKYIESRLVAMAKAAKNSEIENGNNPGESTLSEADRSDMEYFIEQIKIILPTAGYFFLLSSTLHLNKDQNAPAKEKDRPIFFLYSKKISAQMVETDEGFIVLKNSEASKTVSKSISIGWLRIRERLTKNEVLIDTGDNYLFKEDTVFSSASAASSVILGHQSPGPQLWKDENGKSYKEYIEEQIETED